MKILLGDFSVKIQFRPSVMNESLHKMNNENAALLHQKFIMSKMYPHHNIHKYICTSPDWKTCNQIDHVLMGKRQHPNTVDVQSFRGDD
jgi:hypothetical protein